MSSATQYIIDHAEALQQDALPGDEQNNLTERTVQILKSSGGFRLLLAQDLGGAESHPNEFLDWVIAVGSQQPAAGWVAGVVGVHPWEISFMDPRLQEEVYGNSPDTLTASPYAPFGVACPVEGGFLFSGEWPYSTGTTYCDWVILGGRVADADGNFPPGPPDIRHFVLPRGDYDILDNSWNVMGLKGTGSFSVRMQDAFVPDYRVYESHKVTEGFYAQQHRPSSPLYALKFGVMFPAAIAAGTLGIAAGAVRMHHAYITDRVSVSGNVAKTDPVYLQALAAADADLEAGISHLKSMIADLYDQVCAGQEISVEQRLRFRRNHVRATDRVFDSLGVLARLAGSAGIQEDNALERWWRDIQTAITHICNTREGAYTPWGLHQFGGDIPPGALY